MSCTLCFAALYACARLSHRRLPCVHAYPVTCAPALVSPPHRHPAYDAMLLLLLLFGICASPLPQPGRPLSVAFGMDDSSSFARTALAGGCAGITEWLICLPLDTIKTRYQVRIDGMAWQRRTTRFDCWVCGLAHWVKSCKHVPSLAPSYV